MEDWQNKHITKNLDKLIKLTKCNPSLLAKFSASGVLSDEDVCSLEAKTDNFEKSKLLYDILKTKKKGFEILGQALHETRQTGSLEIIEQGYHDTGRLAPNFHTTNPADWQAKQLNQHLDKLVKSTKCNPLFLSILKRSNILSTDDLASLDAKLKSQGTIAQSMALYEILKTKTNSLEVLAKALCQTKQTISLKIIEQAYQDEGKHIPDFKLLCLNKQDITSHSKWDDLTDTLKSEMSKKYLKFQRNEIKLDELIEQIGSENIEARILIELRENKIPTLVNTQIPEQLEYYIHRSVKSRKKLREEVFQSPSDDVFVIQGLEKHELTSLVGGFETDVSGKQIEGVTVRFILLEHKEDFQKICIKTTSPVHLISYQNQAYEWVKSSGPVINLQQYLLETEDLFEENELVSDKHKVVVISDLPGMGKTVLLHNIAQRIMNQQKNTLVRFIVMKEFVQTLSKEHNYEHKVVDLLARESSEFDCGRKLVAHKLNCEPCILMFDGFDEVLPQQIDMANKILKTAAALKFARVYVTTRPHMREELEDALHVLRFTFEPFQEPEQVTFLTRFWGSQRVEMNNSVTQFAESCLKALTLNMTDFEKRIAGIPLQCKLLAEVYKEHAERCSKTGFSSYNDFILLTSIFEMYKTHINMRFDQIYESESIFTRYFGFMLDSKYVEIKKAHMNLALELLFPNHSQQFSALLNTYPPISLDERCRHGIVEKSEFDTPRVVHRTFAEYLVAWFVVEAELSDTLVGFLLEELLSTKPKEEVIGTPFRGNSHLVNSFTFTYPVIAYFINGFTKMFVKNYKDQLGKVSMFMDSVHYDKVANIFTAAAASDYIYIPLAISLCFKPSELRFREKAALDINNLLLITAKYSSVEMMKTFCSQRELNADASTSSGEGVKVTPLHVAVERGHYKLVEYLTAKYDKELINLPCMLHFCLFGSSDDKKTVIDDKKQIIKLLMKKNADWGYELLTLPLSMQSSVELIECLKNCIGTVF